MNYKFDTQLYVSGRNLEVSMQLVDREGFPAVSG
jgi:hypothetical protein